MAPTGSDSTARVLITGASRGIGAAAALRFARAGADLALFHEPRTDRRAECERVAEQAQVLGATVHLFEPDLRDVTATAAAVDGAAGVLGGLDVVVANAATQRKADFEDLNQQDWDDTYQVNVRGTWALAKASLPHWANSSDPSLITVTSVMARTGQIGSLHYLTSKAALIGFTRGLARELGPRGVRVNAVMPGAIATEHEDEVRGRDGDLPADVIQLQALKRRGEAQDVASAFTFLASRDASFITGQVLTVDGGWVMH